jgi:hypothetical protein
MLIVDLTGYDADRVLWICQDAGLSEDTDATRTRQVPVTQALGHG